MNSTHATIIGGIGLVALAVYQFSTGNVAAGVQSVLAALAAFGLHWQINGTDTTTPSA